MAAKFIVSYDGTDLDRDALALGRLLARAGASIALAYVRHQQESGGREALAEHEAEALLAGGAEWLGDPEAPRFVVLSASTPEGLKELAVKVGAQGVVFGSAYRTTPGHVYPQLSAERLMEGGPLAIALAPAGFVDEEGDTSAAETAASLAAKLGATVEERPSPGAGFLVVGSKPAAAAGTVLVSAASAYLVELSRCPTLVVARGTPLAF